MDGSIITHLNSYHTIFQIKITWHNIKCELKENKRSVGLYILLTAGIMTDFVIMILSSINKSVSQSVSQLSSMTCQQEACRPI